LQIIDSKNINSFPTNTLLGYAPINEGLSPDVLTDKELEDWQGFTNKTRKDEFLTARHLFHFLLAQGDLNPNFELTKELLGKPFAQFQGKILNVSFSHSKELVMCAISTQCDIGLDIEWSRRQVNERLVKRFLSENEWKVFGEENPIKLWTMKEAAVKCLGTGLRTNLIELELRKVEENKFSVIINDDKSFQICSFQQLDHQISIAY
tara:strand:- start:6274 stop:6894 length:621 start_codon:yes stop_codon:yes gene_type:complete